MNACDRLLIKKRRMCSLYCFEAKDEVLRNHSNRTLSQYFYIVCYLFLYNKIVLFVTVNFGVLEWKGHSFISFASQRNRVVIFSSSSFSFLNYHPVKAILP